MAIGLSLLGNAAWHLIAARVLTVSWPVVVTVGAIPPAVLGLLSHLAVLRGQDDEDEPPSPGTKQDQNQDEASAPERAADHDDHLFEAACAADDAHRAEHGKAITRDELRKVLSVSTERATRLLREVRKNRQNGR